MFVEGRGTSWEMCQVVNKGPGVVAALVAVATVVAMAAAAVVALGCSLFQIRNKCAASSDALNSTATKLLQFTTC